jgi:hypothetical protein
MEREVILAIFALVQYAVVIFDAASFLPKRREASIKHCLSSKGNENSVSARPCGDVHPRAFILECLQKQQSPKWCLKASCFNLLQKQNFARFYTHAAHERI